MSADNETTGDTPRQEQESTTDVLSYRGGFSSSICDGLFEEHGHSDCCAFTCCGILLYDRNVFLLTGKRPSWRGRCGIAMCFCLVVLAFLVALVAASALYAYEIDHLKSLEADGESPTKEDTNRTNEINTLISVANILRTVAYAMALYMLLKAAQYRYRARRFLMAKMYRERNEESDETEDEQTLATAETPLVASSAGVNTMLQKEACNMCCATAPVGCIPKDAIIDPSRAAALERKNRTADLCHCLWKTLASMCCGACCGCWCQCLGLCAMAQEDRELQRMLPRTKFQVDYITFQPFTDYFPKLEALRENKIDNMLAHFAELSQLSKTLLQTLLVALTFMIVLAFSRYDPLFTPAHLSVVFMTFLQAFVIIYFVHWLWNRFDLSVDAIIKYFASGFILCTANAFVYETFVSTTLSVVATFVRALLDPPMAYGDDDEAARYAAALAIDATGASDRAEIPPSPIWLLGIMAFLNAFAVAAMVEEISKYFGFWMVEHPDLALPEVSGSEDQVSMSNGTSSGQSTTTSQRRTMKSLGAGITIAMVATAVGFACCENFMYVFVYSRTADAGSEFVTLVARSIFPVHPLAAAIQSIGVCQRDIEKDASMKFGRILLPALLLHGSFDFALMFLDVLGRSTGADPDGGTDGTEHYTKFRGEPGGSLDDPTLKGGSALSQLLPALLSSMLIVLIGIIYYVVKALAQRKRLVELDRRQQGGGEYEQIL